MTAKKLPWSIGVIPEHVKTEVKALMKECGLAETSEEKNNVKIEPKKVSQSTKVIQSGFVPKR